MTGRAAAERVASLVMFGFEGTEPASIPRDLAAECGGVILFRRNIRSADQLVRLTAALRDIPRPDGAPLIIALDQEGGPVSRLAEIGTTIPSAMALGAAGDLRVTELMYDMTGRELAALGVNLNLAPVADVNNNPRNPGIGIRSFGDDPLAVARHVRAAVRGLHRAGIGATAKHFPGKGDVTVDAHLGLPESNRTLTQLEDVELVPFSAAIAEGVDVIMSAHVVYRPLATGGEPATLNRALLSGVLRERLHFEGVVCTDCMEMQAIADRYHPGQAAVAAALAGADLILFSHSREKVIAARAALRDAVLDGRLSPAAVEQSLERIAALSRRLHDPGERPPLDSVGSAQHQAAALAAARRAVVVIRDPKGLLPLSLTRAERLLVVEFASAQPVVAVEDGRGTVQTALGPWIGSGGPRLHEQVRSLDPAGHEYKQILMAAGAAHAILVLTCRATAHPAQARVVADLVMLGKRVIVVAGREPYDAVVVPKEATVVASFGVDPHAMQATADVIMGRERPVGTLPVVLPADAPLPP